MDQAGLKNSPASVSSPQPVLGLKARAFKGDFFRQDGLNQDSPASTYQNAEMAHISDRNLAAAGNHS